METLLPTHSLGFRDGSRAWKLPSLGSPLPVGLSLQGAVFYS